MIATLGFPLGTDTDMILSDRVGFLINLEAAALTSQLNAMS